MRGILGSAAIAAAIAVAQPAAADPATEAQTAAARAEQAAQQASAAAAATNQTLGAIQAEHGANARAAADARTAIAEAEAARARAEQSIGKANEIAGRIDAMGQGPSNTDTVGVSAKTLSSTMAGGGRVNMLSEKLDGCLWPAGSAALNPFNCVAMTTRAAARTYRILAGDRQTAADRFTTGAAAGLMVAAAGIDHAASDTIRAWTIAGLLPVVIDDLAQPGPRSRLHNVAAMAMTAITVRAETLNDAKAQLNNVEAQYVKGASWEAACGKAALASLNQAAKSLSDSQVPAEKALSIEAIKLNGVIEARCTELQTVRYRLLNANRTWSLQSQHLARGLARDAVIFDDTVARLDRLLRSNAPDVLKVVFKAPFNVVAKVVNGQVTPPEFTGRAIAVFTEDFTFELSRLPDAALPEPLNANLAAPSSLRDGWGEPVNRVNALTEEVNIAVSAAHVFKVLNAQSVLTVRPGSTNRPVALTAPTQP